MQVKFITIAAFAMISSAAATSPTMEVYPMEAELPTPCPSTIDTEVAPVSNEVYETTAPVVAYDEVKPVANDEAAPMNAELPTPCPTSGMEGEVAAVVNQADDMYATPTPCPSKLPYAEEDVAPLDVNAPTPCASTVHDMNATMEMPVHQEEYADAVEYSTSSAAKFGLGFASVIVPVIMYAL